MEGLLGVLKDGSLARQSPVPLDPVSSLYIKLPTWMTHLSRQGLTDYSSILKDVYIMAAMNYLVMLNPGGVILNHQLLK